MNKQDLMQFEEEIKEMFLDARIKAPVHLSRGNEEPLIEIFREIKKEDWVFSTYRSHYHALLKGIPREWVKNEILAGRSLHLNNKEYRFMTSSLVGGCLPLAIGVAMSIKRKRAKRHVWVFVGDMAAETGVFHECTKYAAKQKLPITFVIENNGLSVNTPTQLVWGRGKGKASIISYEYKRVFPHLNCGQWVTFR